MRCFVGGLNWVLLLMVFTFVIAMFVRVVNTKMNPKRVGHPTDAAVRIFLNWVQTVRTMPRVTVTR